MEAKPLSGLMQVVVVVVVVVVGHRMLVEPLQVGQELRVRVITAAAGNTRQAQVLPLGAVVGLAG
jgi:hypothetical protein